MQRTLVDDLGQILIVLYTLFAIAAGSRAAYQILMRWEEAPLAFSLSALATLIYLLASIGIRQRTKMAWWFTLGACLIELIGILVVGTLTILEPRLFPRATVWSNYGAGYLYIPLILPIFGIAWLVWGRTRTLYGLSA